MPPQTVEYRPSKLKTLLLMVFCPVLIFGGYLLFTDPRSSTGDHWAGLAAMLLFGLAIFVLPFNLFRPRAVLRLGPETIEAVGIFGKRQFELPLREIGEARVVKRGRTRFVALIPRDPEYGLENATPGTRRSAKLSDAMFGSRFLIHTGNYSVKPKRLVEDIHARIATLDAEPGAYPRPVGPPR